MAEPIYKVRISKGVNAKINSLHRLTADEVREVCYSPNHRTKWDDDPVHGRRLLVKGRTSLGRRLEVILAPIDRDQGIWRVKTALVIEGR